MLERAHELGRVEAWCSEAGDGRGRLALVLAGAGLGKTALLERAMIVGKNHGLRVLAARGGELEREMPFGVVRQLFETLVARFPADRRHALFAGAAAASRPLLDPTDERSSGGDPLAVIHGIYWLLANLAEREPLLLLIDDLHWADPQSGRWLAYLSTRLAGLSVLVLAASRPADPDGGEMVTQIATTPGTSGLTLAPLGLGAVSELVRRQLGREGDQRFVAACHHATGGNPFFLMELLRALASDQIEPVGSSAELLPQLENRGIARSILVRLARLGTHARRLANAAAVLGADAELRHAAALAGLGTDEALTGWDALTRGEILLPRQPLEFIHPIARAAVYRELQVGERTRSHRRAAELLSTGHVDPQRVAVHALSCEPAGDSEMVGWLRAAAESAVLAGAPDAAARYLERALREPPSADLIPQLKFELGRALIGIASARAAESFALAAASPDPTVRFLARRWQAYTLSFAGRIAEAMDVYDTVIALAASDPELELHMIGMRDFFYAWWGDAPSRDHRLRGLSERASVLSGASAGERQVLAAAVVFSLMANTVSAHDALALAGKISPDAINWVERENDVTQGAGAFVGIICDAPEAIDLIEQRAIPQCLREGRTVDLGFAQTLVGIIKFRQGTLADAEAGARATWQLMREVGKSAAVIYWWSAAALIEILIARGQLEEATVVFEQAGFGVERPTVVIFPWPAVLRGELVLAQGRLAEGVELLLEAGDWLERRAFRNPTYIPWRAAVAPALVALGRRTEARAVIEPAVERARAFGAPWALGMALRAAGVVHEGDAKLALLREAVEVLAPSRSRLEHARALLELGAALRRLNRRTEARAHLRGALDMAYRCGAVPLAERAAQELVGTGARPRRAVLSGPESLTASERRVAELAARGFSNPDIAQQLFVTRKTVEAHLGHVYQKLNISSREQISAELESSRSL